MKTCYDHFKGTCPAGRKVRHEEDYHSCHRDGVDRCHDPEECCVGFCEGNFHGTCPDGKIFNPHEYCDTPWEPKNCNAEKCCHDPPQCDPNVGAPEGTTHSCTDAPTTCDEIKAAICEGGCYHQCYAKSTNKGFFDYYLQSLGCPETAATICANGGGQCKGGKCCGSGTTYVHGKCVASAAGAIEACKRARGAWGESTCEPRKCA